MRHFARLFASVVCGLFFSTVVLGQGIQTGSLSGSVVDTTAAAVPGASVTATDMDRGTSYDAKSNGKGEFSFQALPIGQYKVHVRFTGFADLDIGNVAVTAGVDHGIGEQKLILGNASTQVEVTASTSLLETTQVQQSASFDSEQLESLPLNNGFDTVALLEPGVAQTHDLNFSNTNGENFSSNGARGRANNFELDGQSNNDNSIAGPQIFFGNQDAIAEIQVIQSNFSAQYGRNTGSVVNYITKSGTNRFHGSAFDLYEGNFLESYPNQDKSQLFGFCPPGTASPATVGCQPIARLPRYVDNRYGGTIGGPIIKDKLFFFGSTYFEHTRNGAQPSTSGPDAVTPTPAGIAELEALFPGNPAVAILQNYGPFSQSIGNPTAIQQGGAMSETVTTPTGSVSIPTASVFRNFASGNFNDQEDLGRLDWQATPRDRVFLRYFYQTQLSSDIPINAGAGVFYDVPDTNYSVGSDLTHTFTSHLLDQIRYSFQQSKVDFQGGTLPNCTVNTLTACPGNLSFLSGTDLGFGQNTALPQGRTVKVTQVQDNATYTHGIHNITFGGEFDYQNSPNVFLPLYNGAAIFADLDSFIQQNGFFQLADGNPVLPFRENDYAGYFQDDVKLAQNFTLNVGLRYEFFGQAINLLHNETVARESNPATAIWDTSLPLSERTAGYVNPYYKNYEPRVGFAWSIRKDLVLRGGYSYGVDPAFYNIFLNASEVAPISTSATFACGGTCLGNGNFTGAGLRAQNLSNLPLGGNPETLDQDYVPSNFRNPYLQTFNLGIEQQITHAGVFSLRYVGSHGVGNFQSVDANPDLSLLKSYFPNYPTPALCTTPGAPGTEVSSVTGFATARPNCNQSNVSQITNGGFTLYNSLQTSFTTRNLAGFTGSVNYTFSHATDNSSEIFSTGAGGSTISLPQNPLDPNIGERGTSGFSYPNVLSIGMTYATPDFHKGNALVRSIMDGYRVNTVYQYNSGQPYNPYQYDLSQLDFSADLGLPPGTYALTPSLCDNAFNASTVGPGADSCRLALTNKQAKPDSVAIVDGIPLLGLPTGSYEFTSFLAYFETLGGTPTPTPLPTSSAHWTINNANYAQQVNNPYPGSGRNILRGQRFNNLDASVFKDTKLRDHLTMELQLDVYNALNHQYRGTPSSSVFGENPSAVVDPFLSNAYNSSGSRLVQLGGKIKF